MKNDECHHRFGPFLLSISLLLHIAAGYLHLSQPEKPINLQLDLCSHHLKPIVEHEMLYMPEDARICTRLISDHNLLNLEHERHHTTLLRPTVIITWAEVNSSDTCKLHFKIREAGGRHRNTFIVLHHRMGDESSEISERATPAVPDFQGYRGEYRIAPDLGNYGECQRPLSAYISLMANGVVPKWNSSTSRECPIEQLPFSYSDYLACEIQADRWYRLKFSSTKFYETFHHKKYRQFRANYSVTFYFMPRQFLSMNGDQHQWLRQLFQIKTRHISCDTIDYLVVVDDRWPMKQIPLVGSYRMRSSSTVYLSQTLFNATGQWFHGDFVVLPTDDVHEICVQMLLLPEAIVFCESLAVSPEDCAVPDDASSRHRSSLLIGALLLLPLLGVHRS